jgi:hypothetical protein
VQNKGGSDDIELRANWVLDGGARAFNLGGGTGDAFFRPSLSTTQANFEARNIRAIANVIIGSVTPIGFVGCVDCLVANNTIIDPQNWLLRILQEHVSDDTYTFLPASNGRFINNVVYFSRADLSSSDVNIGPNTDAPSFVFLHNLWFAHDNPAASAPQMLPSDEVQAIHGQDPGFTNAVGQNFHIGSSSAAANTGLALVEVQSDYDAHAYAATPSRGAFEMTP